MTGDSQQPWIHLEVIRPEQVLEARRAIYSVARGLFQPDRTLEEASAAWDAEGVLSDMDDVQASYFANGGTFLVLMAGERIIGTGALRRIDARACELKRLWLLPAFHGQGLGYQIMRHLLDTARQMGYQVMRLETDATRQPRAVAFYRRLGFHDIPRYGDDPDAVAMEMSL